MLSNGAVLCACLQRVIAVFRRNFGGWTWAIHTIDQNQRRSSDRRRRAAGSKPSWYHRGKAMSLPRALRPHGDRDYRGHRIPLMHCRFCVRTAMAFCQVRKNWL